MAEENLVTRIVAKSDFSDLIGDLNKVSSRLAALQQQLNNTNKTLAVQAANMQKAFGSTLRSTGQFSSHFVSLSSDVEKFGKSLDSGKMRLGQYFQAWQQHAKTSGGVVRDLAKQQVQMENAILQPLGKNAQGLMQFSVHVPRGLDTVKNKAALARQEMMIMNKVIQDGANQVINWGKNTQWAGRQLTVGLTLPIAMFGKAASDAFRQADEQLVRLTKVYGGVAATSAQELGKIREEVSATAREMSAAYGASYKDTIGLAADIAATGKQGKDLIDSTKETTRLSILGEVDRQDAMKATLALQTAFKQNTTELAESINFLNAVENQTSTSLADLVEAIPKAGPVVKSLGGDVQDLALYLTAMREGGINASEGANALKSALASIINPTKVAKEQFLGFGINLEKIVTSNAGNLTATILEIQSALDNLDPLQKSKAIEQLFGKFQFARMSALFENLGKQGSQTLQVLDLMKASSQDLANIAGRELSQITESASGKYKRALETLKADMAGVGEQFLGVATKLINVIDGVLKFFNKLPDPIKNILGFVAGLTALTGPIIMLTGLMANFFGYIAKGLFHFKALIKGGQGFKLLTPELLAAEKAGSLLETTFYDDAKASAVLKQAISSLTAELALLETKANSARVAVGPAIRTLAGGVVSEGVGRVADPTHPLIGKPYSRAFAHMNPVSGMTPDERLAQTIFGVSPNPTPLNRKIGANPQIYMSGDMPRIEGVTSIKGASTGIVASEAAKWHSMTAALAMQSRSELDILKREVVSTGTITSELAGSYSALLPKMTSITQLASQEAEMIVGQLQAGKLTVEQARAKITALNAQIEGMMSSTAAQVAAAQGRTLNLTTVPLTNQPVVDPNTGKSNMKELFHKGPTSSLVDSIARSLGVKTSGGGYSIETTRAIRRNLGGKVYNPAVHGNVVPGDTSINYDNTPAILREGGFILNQTASKNNPDLVSMAQNANNQGGRIVPALLTPGETYFPPEMAGSIMPMLEKANSGSKITLKNLGGMVGGRISPNRFNYGMKPGFMTYAQIKSALQAIVGTRTGSKTILNYMRRPQLSAGVLKAAPQTIDEMMGIPLGKGQSYNEFGHVVNAKGEISIVGKVAKPATAVYGERSESANKALSGEGLTGNQYNDFLRLLLGYGKGSILGSTSQLFASIPKGIATKKLLTQIDKEISSRYIRELFRMKRAGTALKDENNPYHDISSQVLKELAPNNKHLQNIWGQWSTSTSAVNPHYINEMKKGRGATSAGARDIELINPKTGERFVVPALKGSGNSVAYHAANKDWESKYAYDVTRNWPKKEQHWGMGHQYDLLNRDPLHGPIQIGNAASVAGDTAGTIAKQAYYSDKFGRLGFQDVGGFNSDPVAQANYLVRRYMAGDKSIMSQMAYETRNKLNAHPLSIQSKLQAVNKKYTGELFRGVTKGGLADTLPANIVKEIELAKATGDASALIGKEFIMRRASFSSDPTVASYFSGFGKDGLVIQALLKNRNVTPVSELNPDTKFTAPYGQQWGSSLSGNMMSEKESLVGGKFRIKDFKDGKLVVETVGIEAREKGGDVNAGQPYLVGEKGPELFIPRNSGGIVANNVLGGMVRAGKHNYGMSVERVTTTGYGGAKNNAYRVVGSPMYTPGLSLPFASGINRTGDAISKVFWQQLVRPIDKGIYKLENSLKNSARSITGAFSRIQSSVNTGVATLSSTPAVNPMAVHDRINATTGTGYNSVYPNPMPRYWTGARSQPFDMAPLPYQVDADGNKIKYSKFAGDKGAIFRRSSAMLDPRSYKNSMPSMPRGPFRAGGMGTWVAGGMAGGAGGGFIGKKLGGEGGQAIGTMVGSMGLPMLITGLSSLSVAAAAAGVSMGSLIAGMAVAAAPFVAVAAVVAALGYGFVKYKNHLEDVGQANRAVFGATKETMDEVGLAYKSNTQSLKDYMAQQELAKAAGVAAYNKSTTVGGPLGLTLSIEELKKGIEDAKKNAKETISNINNVGDNNEVIKLAASMKQQYISAGMSVQEATNKVYTLIKASDKGYLAFSAVTSKAFTSIKDQSTAANYAVNVLVREMKSGSVNAEEMAVGIDNMLVSLNAYQNSLVGTKDANGQIVTQQDAQLDTLKKITKIAGAWSNVSSEVLDQIKSQDVILGSVLGKNESLVSIYAKQALLRGGFEGQVDIYSLSEKDAVLAAKGMAAYQEEVAATVLSTEGPLGSLNGLYNKTTKAIESMTKASESYGKATKYDKIIKDQNALIKKIKEETDARLKALDAQKATADFNTQIKKEQLAYQTAIQSGDMVGAAQAQLNIQQINADRQDKLAREAIQADADRRVKIAEDKITKAQEAIDKRNDAAQAAQTAATNKMAEQTAIASFRDTVQSIAGGFVDRKSLSGEERQKITGLFRDALTSLKSVGGEAAKYAGGLLSGYKTSADEEKQFITPELKFLDALNDISEQNAKDGKFGPAVDTFLGAVNIFAKTVGGFDPSAKSGSRFNPTQVKSGMLDTALASYNAENKNANFTLDDIFDGTKLTDKGRKVLMSTRTVVPGEFFMVKNRLYKMAENSGFSWNAGGQWRDRKGIIGANDPLYEINEIDTNKATGGPIPRFFGGGQSKGSYVPGQGGYIRGEGTPTSDSIVLPVGNGGIIRASDMEFMQPASAVSYYGTDFMEDLRARRIPKEVLGRAMGGAIPGYATAGPLHNIGMQWGGKKEESLWSKLVHGGMKYAMKKISPTLFGKNVGYDFGGGKEIANVLSGSGKKSDYLTASLSAIPGGSSVKAGAKGLTELSPYILKRGSDGMDIVSDYILATRGHGTNTVVDGWSNVVHKPGSASELFSIGNTAGPAVTRDLLALSLMFGAKEGGVGRLGINIGASADRSIFAESLVSKLRLKGLDKVVGLPAKEESSVGSEKVEALSWMYGHLNMLNTRAKWGPDVNGAAAISNEALGISKSGLSMLMRGKYDRDSFLELLGAFNNSMKGHKGFANGGAIPGYSWAGKIANVFKLGGKGGAKVAGKAGAAGAVWQGMEDIEKFLSLKYGADQEDSKVEKWGKAFARFGFNALQGGVSGAAATKGRGFVGGSIYGTIEGLVGLIKDGSQYGVKGGSSYTDEALAKRKDLQGAQWSRFFNYDGGADINQVADYDLANMSPLNSLKNMAKTGLISSILPGGLGGLRSAANVQAAARQGVRVFDRTVPKFVNDLMELGFINPTTVLKQRNNILTNYQEAARNSLGEFPEILAGKGAVNIFGPRGYAAKNVDAIRLKSLIFNRGTARWVRNIPGEIAAFLNPFNKAAKANNYSAHVPHDSNEVIMPGWKSSLDPEDLLKMPAKTLSQMLERGRKQAHSLQEWAHSGSPNTLFHELGHRQLNIMGGTQVLRSWATNQQTKGAHGLHEAFADLFQHGAYEAFQKAGIKTGLTNRLGIGDTYVSNPGATLLEDMIWRLGSGLNKGRMHQMGTEFLVPYTSLIKEKLPKEELRKLLAMIRIEGANLRGGNPKLQVQALYDTLSEKLPKFHDGGQVNTKFAGGEMMALLKDKEHVLTPEQMSSIATPVGATQIMYTVAPVINAAPGMDEGALVNMATRQVMSELTYLNKMNNATIGRPEMRVIR